MVSHTKKTPNYPLKTIPRPAKARWKNSQEEKFGYNRYAKLLIKSHIAKKSKQKLRINRELTNQRENVYGVIRFCIKKEDCPVSNPLTIKGAITYSPAFPNSTITIGVIRFNFSGRIK